MAHDTTDDATRHDRDATPSPDDLLAELRRDKAYLQEALDRALAQLAAERERADVLMREALGRIEALTAGPVADAGENAALSTQDRPHEERAGDVADDASAPWWRRWWHALQEGG